MRKVEMVDGALRVTDDRVIHVEELERFPDAVYIGRRITMRYPGRYLKTVAKKYERSVFANPYRIGEHMTREMAIAAYRELLFQKIANQAGFVEALVALRGKRLACWCRRSDQEITPATACHGDRILEALDQYTDAELRMLYDPITLVAR